MPSPPSLSFRAVAVITSAIALPAGVSADSRATLPPAPAAAYSEVTEFTPPELPPVPEEETSDAAESDLSVRAPDGGSSAERSAERSAENEGNDRANETTEASDSTASTDEAGKAIGKAGPVNLICLARTICEVKQRIRWRTPAWAPTKCEGIARAVLSASAKYDISPTLLLGVMTNESDLDENAARVTRKNNRIYAKDSGLMALRCVLDARNRCINNNLRGMKWTQVMDPATNIALGAKELAQWRDGGAYVRKVVKLRDSSGRVRPVFKNVPCQHKDHGFWAHYNHGPVYIDRGNPRHYPHHVAVLDHAFASVLNLDPPELHQARITVRDPGRPQRTADHPLEARYRRLCSIIESVHACSPVAMN